MAGVEVIDRHPIELRPQILFHARHQPPGQGLEILIAIAILGRDDEAELMAILSPLFEKGLAIHHILIASVELPALALACSAVPLKIAQVSRRRASPLPESLTMLALTIARRPPDMPSGPRLARMRPTPAPRPIRLPEKPLPVGPPAPPRARLAAARTRPR
jgi:hypothetical protein